MLVDLFYDVDGMPFDFRCCDVSAGTLQELFETPCVQAIVKDKIGVKMIVNTHQGGIEKVMSLPLSHQTMDLTEAWHIMIQVW